MRAGRLAGLGRRMPAASELAILPPQVIRRPWAPLVFHAAPASSRSAPSQRAHAKPLHASASPLARARHVGRGAWAMRCQVRGVVADWPSDFHPCRRPCAARCFLARSQYFAKAKAIAREKGLPRGLARAASLGFHAAPASSRSIPYRCCDGQREAITRLAARPGATRRPRGVGGEVFRARRRGGLALRLSSLRSWQAALGS